eukprot:PhF_6_TR18725/c0_g1_i3/m.27355/K20398/LAMTOR2; ragulator complex protein LAMTOR2
MLQVKSLIATLNQAKTNGIQDVLLVHPDGSVVVSADSSNSESERVLLSAILSNVWSLYGGADFDCVLLETQQRRIGLTSVGGLMLCAIGDTAVEVGMLRRKVAVIKEAILPAIQTVTGGAEGGGK